MTRNHYDCTGRQLFPVEGEWIGACPPVERYTTPRPPVALQDFNPQGQTTVKYDDGELGIITYQNPLPSEAELHFILAEERAKRAVKKLTFVMSNAVAETNLGWFQKKKFYRNEGHPLAQYGMIAFSKEYPVERRKP